MALPSNLLGVKRGRPSTLKDVSEALDQLMLAAGYSERAYYRLRENGRTNGFAVVTRLERIRSDGTPFPPEERFMAANAPDQFDVVSFLKSLFVAPVGYYRVIVMMVSKASISTSMVPMTSSQADTLLAQGAARLRGCVARFEYTDAYEIDALIYEFRHEPEATSENNGVRQLKPGTLDAGLHLERAGLLAPAALRGE